MTAVCVDGNSVSAAVVSLGADGSAVIHATRTLELELLVERVGRAVHPIFMDVSYIEFPDPSLLQRALDAVLDSADFRHPLVAVMPAEMVSTWREEGDDSREGRETRLRRGLRGLQSANPLWFPRLFGFDDRPTQAGLSCTRLWSMRFDDMTQCAEQYQGRNTPFLGMVTGDRALNEVFSYMGRMDTSRPLALVDVGKLRTLYLGGFLGRPLFIHAIPVGLARDDQHYFTSITPTLAHLDAIDRQLGTLLFPPDATPSPVFDPLISTPQVDCTRFSMQVARYADRTRRDLLGMTGGSNSVFYVTGRASRLPGFRRYLESKTSVRFRRLDRRPVDGIHPEGNVTWPDVSDHLLPIGAALAYHRREATRQGLVLRDRRPENLVTADIDPLSLAPGNLYVIGSPSRGDSQRFSSASVTEREALSEG